MRLGFSGRPRIFAGMVPYEARDGASMLKIGRNHFRLKDAYEGCFITGQTGSGKSSGPGRALAQAYLRAGMGMLVLAAKPGEADQWQHWCNEAGRGGDLIVFGEHFGRFNFLDYECRRGGPGAGETLNLVDLLMKIMESAQRFRKGGAAGDPFWQTKARETLGHSIDALRAAYGNLRLGEIVRFIQDAPGPGDDLQSAAWRTGNFCAATMQKAATDPVRPLAAHDLQVVSDFFAKDFKNLAEKTRSGITAEIMGMLHPFLKGTAHRLFCTETTVVPELCLEGAVLVIDMPLKQWSEVGALAQGIFKFLFQRMAERRDIRVHPRPLGLFMDECHFFVSDYDNEFQSTARASRVATVALTQNLPTVMEHIGGRHPEHAAKQWLGNFTTKIFCANGCDLTNQWASQMIGRGLQQRRGTSEGESAQGSYSRGSSHGSQGQGMSPGGSGWSSSRTTSTGESRGFNRSQSMSEVMDQLIEPAEFARHLRRGGPEHGFLVDTILYRPGERFVPGGRNWTRCSFRQR